MHDIEGNGTEKMKREEEEEEEEEEERERESMIQHFINSREFQEKTRTVEVKMILACHTIMLNEK